MSRLLTRSQSTSRSAFSQIERPLRLDLLAGPLVDDSAAAGRDDARPGLQEPLHYPRLQRAKFLLAVSREKLGDRHARNALDLVIAIDERNAELMRPTIRPMDDLPAPIRPTKTRLRDRARRVLCSIRLSPAFRTGSLMRSIHTLFANGIDKCGCSVKSQARETCSESGFLHLQTRFAIKEAESMELRNADPFPFAGCPAR